MKTLLQSVHFLIVFFLIFFFGNPWQDSNENTSEDGHVRDPGFLIGEYPCLKGARSDPGGGSKNKNNKSCEYSDPPDLYHWGLVGRVKNFEFLEIFRVSPLCTCLIHPSSIISQEA